MAGMFQSFIQGTQAREQSDANQLALQQARQKVADQNKLRQLARDSVQPEAFTDYPTMDGEKLPGLYTGNQRFDATGYKNRLYGAGMVEQAQAMEKAQADAQAAAERAGLKSEKIRAGIGKDQAQTGLYGVQTQEHQAKVQDALRSGRLKATRDALGLVQTGNVGAGLAHYNASVPEGERITDYRPMGKGLVLTFENGQQMQIPDVDGMIGRLEEALTKPDVYAGQRNQETRRHNQSMENLGVAGLAERDNYHQGMLGLYGMGGRPPAGYRPTPDGGLAPIPGGPADPTAPKVLKPLPSPIASGMLDNLANLRKVDTAMQLASGRNVDGRMGDTSATGIKGWLPNQVLNRIDPQGVDTRAIIADLGSMVIHDRSGAAVTAAEFPRLAPFIPTEKDDQATVLKKLNNFKRVYGEILRDQQSAYGPEMGYKPLAPVEQYLNGGSRPSAPQRAPTAAPTRQPATTAPSAADIRFTAQKYGITEAEVRRRLGIR